jgi:CBS domain-containing protein
MDSVLLWEDSMKTIIVKDLIVPRSEYATISKDSNLFEAVTALVETRKKFGRSDYAPRAMLVFDKDSKIVGKLSMLDVLVALEPKYGEMGEIKKFSTHGFSKNFILALEEQYRLWDKPLDDVCRKATELRVQDCMTKPSASEYIEEDASLSQAINQLVVGRHQSLLVTSGEEIVGLLRLTDVFDGLYQNMKTSCLI